MAEKFSFSKLALHDSCPALYASRYGGDPNITRMPKETSYPLRVGRLFHLWHENYVMHLQQLEAPSDLDAVLPILERVASTDRENKTTDAFEDVAWLAREFAKQYHHDFESFMGTEVFLSRELPDINAEIVGYPDFVSQQRDGKGEFILAEDRKTGWKAETSPSHKFQGEMMCWLLEPTFPGRRAYGVHFVRDSVHTAPVELKPARVPALEAHMRAIIARIRDARERRRFDPSPGAQCLYCGIARSCAARLEQERVGLAVSDAESAKAALGERLILEAALARVDDQLRDYASAYGPIELNGAALGYWSKQGGPKIADAMDMIVALGISEAIAEQRLADAKAYESAAPEVRNAVLALGVAAATRGGLLSVNGNKTRTKGVQNDPRLSALWVPGDARTEFSVKRGEQVKEEVAS